MRLQTARRLVTIYHTLIRYRLDELIPDHSLFRSLQALTRITPKPVIDSQTSPRAQRIREALEELGPIFVKFGQTLSTRRDLLPEDIADELAKLQDNVAPFDAETARLMIEEALGAPVTNLFASFEQNAMAAASIAQVHAATLANGDSVVVKILRPEVEQQIRKDLEVMFVCARIADRYLDVAHRLRPIEIVEEFEKTIIDELDLVREAANAALLRRNFEGSEILYVPKVYWDLTRSNVLVLERIHGTPIANKQQLEEQGIDCKSLAERGVEIFFTQVLRDNFFHADMHPGNIFVTPQSSYIAVDFGIVGSLTEQDRHYLASNLLAFFNRDYRKVAELHVESGWVPEHTRVDEMESAIRSVCEPIFGKPLSEISYGQLLIRLFQAARRFEATVQPQLILFQKTLLNIEGLGRELYPQLDLWQTAKPYIETWMKQQISVQASVKKAGQQLPELVNQIPEVPGLAYKALNHAASGNMTVSLSEQQNRQQLDLMRSNHRKLTRTIIGAALLISASIMLPALPVASGLLGIAGIALLLHSGLL
ncbi:MAG: ubiquinone biosynthesis regulatory protein kinase UbiB [Gammaproteobacteria bacterium]|nr:ubiquinone biosynthesis regulatory protein kinase UbiB [Gammaproteobacteria bacterium]